MGRCSVPEGLSERVSFSSSSFQEEALRISKPPWVEILSDICFLVRSR